MLAFVRYGSDISRADLFRDSYLGAFSHLDFHIYFSRKLLSQSSLYLVGQSIFVEKKTRIVFRENMIHLFVIATSSSMSKYQIVNRSSK